LNTSLAISNVKPPKCVFVKDGKPILPIKF
jgi:hypothetical protein